MSDAVDFLERCTACGTVLVAEPLTGRQAELLRFLDRYHRETGLMPSYPEIGAALGSRRMNLKPDGVLSAGAVCELVAVLKRKGWIAHARGSSRSITFTAAAVRWLDEHNRGKR